MCYYKDKIDDEFGDAENYLYKAEALKDDDKEAADILKTLAEQELNHAVMIYKLGIRRKNEVDKKWFTRKYNKVKMQLDDYSKF